MADFGDEALIVGVAVGRRVLQTLSERRELSLLEAIALATKEVLTVIDGSEDPFAALDQFESLEESLR